MRPPTNNLQGVAVIPRNDVINRQGESQHAAVRQVVGKINEKLHAADTLPVKLNPDEIGEDVRVRNAVVKFIRAAGWTFDTIRENGDLSSPVTHYLLS